MKKLVKTAKQQFEERLEHFNLMQEWENQHCQGRIGKDLSGEGVVIFVHESDEDGYSEYHYPSFSELRDDSNFVQNCLREFSSCSDEFILSIVRWFTYDSTENPFDAVDIYFPADTFRTPSSVEFKDLYEEVPDVRIITAKEQWERDSKGLIAVRNCEDGTLFVNITESAVKFYDNYDGYSCYSYLSLEEMRKDSLFISRVTDELMRSAHHNDIGTFMEWIREGGDFPLNPAVIYDSEYQGCTFKMYTDKEAKTIEKKDFSSEIEGLRERMVAHIEDLYKIGFSLNAEEFMENTETIAWVREGCYDTANLRTCYLRDDEDAVCRFCFETLVAAEGDSEDYLLSNFSIETLSKIIASMHY